MNKEVNQLIKELEGQDFIVNRTRRNHVKVYDPKGSNMVVLSCTPSDKNAVKNARRQFRKLGFKG